MQNVLIFMCFMIPSLSLASKDAADTYQKIMDCKSISAYSPSAKIYKNFKTGKLGVKILVWESTSAGAIQKVEDFKATGFVKANGEAELILGRDVQNTIRISRFAGKLLGRIKVRLSAFNGILAKGTSECQLVNM